MMVADVMTQPQRSLCMSRIRGKDTQPELWLRRHLHALGYRYRLHGGSLPGRPDLVFATRRKVIFVNGCFWHQHEGCRNAATPKTRPEFWAKKLKGNTDRDVRVRRELEAAGWSVHVFWECEIGNEAALASVEAFLGQPLTGK